MSAAKSNTLRRLVRRWWGMGLFLCLCAAWVVWCLHDPLAFMFWLPLAVAAIPAALSIPPNASGQPRLAETKKEV